VVSIYHLKNPIFDGKNEKHVPNHQPLVFNGFIDVNGLCKRMLGLFFFA
jgi:hypothetical protein